MFCFGFSFQHSTLYATLIHIFCRYTLISSVCICCAEGSKDEEKAGVPNLLTSGVYESSKHRGQHWEGLCFLFCFVLTRLKEATAAFLCSATCQMDNKLTKTSILCLNVWLLVSLRKFTLSLPKWPFDLLLIHWICLLSWVLKHKRKQKDKWPQHTPPTLCMSGM